MKEIKECEQYNDFKAKMLQQIEDAKVDFEEFFLKENGTAGLRLRKRLKAIGKYVKSVHDISLPRNNKK